MSNYVYIKSEPNLWTVGFYDPEGKWHAESDYNTTERAANRVRWLNGGQGQPDVMHEAQSLIERINEAFYVKGTTKALLPVMSETKPFLAKLRSAIGGAQ